MIDFETAIKLGEEVLATLEKLYHLIHQPLQTSAGAGGGLTTLLQFRRKLLAVHAKRHLVTELTATGTLSEREAQAMVDEGSSQPTSATAASPPFGNILTWLQANGPAIAQDIAAAIPLLISLLTLFGA